MELTLTGEYAIRVLVFIAENLERPNLQITELALECGIPDQYLRKIIPQLTKAGVLTSQRGNGGGIKLAKSSDEISLLEVIEAIEGKIFLNKCLLSADFCNRTSWCSVHCVWIEAQDKLKEVLANRSVRYLAEQNKLNRKKLTDLTLNPSPY